MTETRSTGYTAYMKVLLSNQGMLRNFGSFLETVDLEDESTLEISTNEKWITVHPAILVFTTALAMRAGKSRSHIVGSLPSSAASLSKMGFFDFVSTHNPFNNSNLESSGKYIPISLINSQADQSRFISDMVPLLHLSEDKSTIIKYVIGELIKNTLEHSLSQGGALVAAQYYPKSNRISIGICDQGIGIWNSMNTVWHPRTDIDAIKLALMPGISGTTSREGGTGDNAGAGLFFIKSIARITRSYFTIYSGKGVYTLNKYDKRIKGFPRLNSDPEKDDHSESNEAPDFGGTLVGVDITLDDNPEFDTLLSVIGDVFGNAIRERKKSKYRRPRFI